MVYKPSELTPLTALALAELAITAGIPRGVFNIVQASHPNNQVKQSCLYFYEFMCMYRVLAKLENICVATLMWQKYLLRDLFPLGKIL